MYRFDIAYRSDGGVRVTCSNDAHHSERGLARKLVNDGAPDGPIEAGRVGRVDYRVASLHAFASRRMVERDAGGLHVVPYEPHPHAQVSPALQHAISASLARVKNRRKAATASPAPECVENALATA